MSAVVTPRRTSTPPSTSTPPAIRSSKATTRRKAGAGATSTTISSRSDRRPRSAGRSSGGRDGSVVAARGGKPLAGKPRGIVGGQEHGDTGDVVRLSHAAKRRARNHRFLDVAADDARGVGAFGLDAARCDRIDADLARSELGS